MSDYQQQTKAFIKKLKKKRGILGFFSSQDEKNVKNVLRSFLQEAQRNTTNVNDKQKIRIFVSKTRVHPNDHNDYVDFLNNIMKKQRTRLGLPGQQTTEKPARQVREQIPIGEPLLQSKNASITVVPNAMAFKSQSQNHQQQIRKMKQRIAKAKGLPLPIEHQQQQQQKIPQARVITPQIQAQQKKTLQERVVKYRMRHDKYVRHRHGDRRIRRRRAGSSSIVPSQQQQKATQTTQQQVNEEALESIVNTWRTAMSTISFPRMCLE